MHLKTLDNALHVLKYFTKENPIWGVRELAKEANMNSTVIYRILATYEKHGFLIKDSETSKYQLGYKFWEYSMLLEHQPKLYDLLLPFMEKLSKETEESVFLTWLDGTEAICIGIVESLQPVKFEVTVGMRKPLYAGAANKVIMAYLAEEIQHKIISKGLNKYASQTCTDPDELLQTLQEIRDQGWCYTCNDFTEDTAGIGMPLFDNQNQVFASLNVAAPEYRLPQSKVDKVVEIMFKVNNEVQAYIHELNLHYSQIKKMI